MPLLQVGSSAAGAEPTIDPRQNVALLLLWRAGARCYQSPSATAGDGRGARRVRAMERAHCAVGTGTCCRRNRPSIADLARTMRARRRCEGRPSLWWLSLGRARESHRPAGMRDERAWTRVGLREGEYDEDSAIFRRQPKSPAARMQDERARTRVGCRANAQTQMTQRLRRQPKSPAARMQDERARRRVGLREGEYDEVARATKSKQEPLCCAAQTGAARGNLAPAASALTIGLRPSLRRVP